jgi:hypothetical protein
MRVTVFMSCIKCAGSWVNDSAANLSAFQSLSVTVMETLIDDADNDRKSLTIRIFASNTDLIFILVLF